MNRRHLTYDLAVNHLADLKVCIYFETSGFTTQDAELKTMRGSISTRRAGTVRTMFPSHFMLGMLLS